VPVRRGPAAGRSRDRRHVSEELVIALVGVGSTLSATFLGHWFSARNQRRQDRRADLDRLRRACVNLVVAIGELQGSVTAHQMHWLALRPKMLTSLTAWAEFAAAHAKGQTWQGLAASLQTVGRWNTEVDTAERANTVPSMFRLQAAAAEVVTLAEDDLGQAAMTLMNAATAAAAATGRSSRQRQESQRDLDVALEVFGKTVRTTLPKG